MLVSLGTSRLLQKSTSNKILKSAVLSTSFWNTEIIKMSLSTSSDPASSLPARKENDSMGEMSIEAGKLWGAQTQRSIGNFPIGGPESKSKFSFYTLLERN